MKLINLLPVLSLALFVAAGIVYAVYARKERKETKYARPKPYVRETESEYLNNLNQTI